MNIKRPRFRVVLACVSALIAGAAAVPTVAFAQMKAEVSRYYEDALKRYEKDDFTGAVIQLKNALKIDRDQLPVQMLLGKAMLAQGDIVAAEVAFGESLRLGVSRGEVVLPLAQVLIHQGKQALLLKDERFALAGLPRQVQASLLLHKAGAHADLGDNREALAAIDEARAIDPSAPGSWLAEVPVRIRGGQLAQAQAAAEKALALAPESSEAMYAMGQVAHVRGRLPAALAYYDKALATRPLDIEVRVSRAGLLMDLDRLDDALRDVAALLKASPTEPRASYLKALLSERQGKQAEARDAFNLVTGLLDPVPPEFLRYRPQLLMLGGLSHYALRQFEKARPYLEAVLRQQPGSPVAKLLAKIHLGEKNVDRAISTLEAYVRTNPQDAQALLLLASSNMSQGRYTRATQLIQQALQAQDAPGMHALLGLNLLGSGQYADAAAELESAIKKDPRQLQAGSALIALYLKSGQAHRALPVAQALVKAQPNHPGLQMLLGDVHNAAGDHKRARLAYEEALKLEPKLAAPQVGLARLDQQGGAPEAAMARLNKVLATEANNGEAISALASSLEAAGRLEEARRLLEKADDLSGPDNVADGLALVEFHLRNQQVALAREALKRITVKAPEAVPVLLMSARVSLSNGDAPTARTTLTRVAGLAGYDVPLLLRVALQQMNAGHGAGAAHTLDKALTERPGYVPGLALRAQVDIYQGNLRVAEERAREIIAKAPKAGVGHGLLGEVALAAGQAGEAIGHFRRAQQVEPSTDNVMRLHRVLAAQTTPDASQPIEAWLKAHPEDLIVRRALADAYARSGNLPAARAAYEAYLKRAPDDAEVLNNLANVLITLKDPGALAVAERALARRPTVPHILGTAGWAAFQAGKTDRALQLLRDARLRDPSNPETRYFLGAVLHSAGRSAEAREELQAALQNDRSFASAPDAEALLRALK